jgi:hypothetical protein
MGKQRVVLKHHAEAALLRRQEIDPLRVERDGPAGHRQEPGDAVERGGLAAARWPEQADELAAPDGQREFTQRRDLRATGISEVARDAVEPQFLEIRVHRAARSMFTLPIARRRRA